jgi:hypothetical protein
MKPEELKAKVETLRLLKEDLLTHPERYSPGDRRILEEEAQDLIREIRKEKLTNINNLPQ